MRVRPYGLLVPASVPSFARTVRVFLDESSALGDMTPAQVQLDAFMQVKRWLQGLGL